jgi:hypothetical protein
VALAIIVSLPVRAFVIATLGSQRAVVQILVYYIPPGKVDFAAGITVQRAQTSPGATLWCRELRSGKSIWHARREQFVADNWSRTFLRDARCALRHRLRETELTDKKIAPTIGAIDRNIWNYALNRTRSSQAMIK